VQLAPPVLARRSRLAQLVPLKTTAGCVRFVGTIIQNRWGIDKKKTLVILSEKPSDMISGYPQQERCITAWRDENQREAEIADDK